jgi:hypothetical protein
MYELRRVSNGWTCNWGEEGGGLEDEMCVPAPDATAEASPFNDKDEDDGLSIEMEIERCRTAATGLEGTPDAASIDARLDGCPSAFNGTASYGITYPNDALAPVMSFPSVSIGMRADPDVLARWKVSLMPEYDKRLAPD